MDDEPAAPDKLSVALEQRLWAGFSELPAWSEAALSGAAVAVLEEVATQLHDNYPYHHPLYAGQMLKPPHPIARHAYLLAMNLNPNNHALDGGRASSKMEKAAVSEIAELFGWRRHLGHLTGGGTMANLEALWIAGKLHPGQVILASSHAHYTHARISDVLGLTFESVAVDGAGRMDPVSLQARLARGDVGAVVATLGTTGLGAVDPLADICELAGEYGCRVHADAAYGGYFRLLDNLAAEPTRAFASLERVDSLVVDPHKHGLQPYGCGCVLFAEPEVGRFYQHDSPYTYFSSDELHLGEISLECSRAGAAAVALWATQRLLPLVPGGEFAAGLAAGCQAARELVARLSADADWLVLPDPDLDIVVFAPAREDAVQISAASREIFEQAASLDLHLALINLDAELLAQHWPSVAADAGPVTCLRSVLMKPAHLVWLDEIWRRLQPLSLSVR